MVKLKRLKIGKYRNVKPGTELRFRDSLNVLLGRNGTGKTTLLNLMVQLLSWDLSQFQNEATDLEYELETDKAVLTVRLRTAVAAADVRDVQSLAGEMLTLGLAQSNARHATALEIEVAQSGSTPWMLRVEGSELTVNIEDEPPYKTRLDQSLLVQRSLFPLVFALASNSSPKPVQERALTLMAAAEGLLLFRQRFDESLGYLGQSIEKAVISVLRGVALFDGPISIADSLTEALSLNAMLDELSIDSRAPGQWFLRRLVALLGFESAQVRLQRIARSAGPDVRLDFGNIAFYFTKRDGSIIHHSLLSYGQKRLLAFYCYLASYPGCVVADELVNGMHHEWIEACLEDLGNRQAFLTSQNPLLLDYLSFESAEEVRSSFVLCRTEFQEGREQMIWENMTEEDSEGFFKAYRVAIQHVSELLRTRRLW